MFNQILVIAAGGAFGAVSRFFASHAVYHLLGRNFPYGTLFVNVAGSFLMGLLFILFIERFSSASEWRSMILIGFLGSFTTFSTFSMETLTLLQQADYLKAGLNILSSVVLCLLAAWLGVLLARIL